LINRLPFFITFVQYFNKQIQIITQTHKTNMTKNKLLITLSFILLFSVAIISCNKKEEVKQKMVEYELKENYVIPQAYALSGIKIKDSINKIYGGLLIPMSGVKENTNYVKPIVDDIGLQMQDFVDQVKKRNNTKGSNFIEVRPAYFVFHGRQLYSCLIKKTICFAQEDTIKSYNTIIYDYQNRKILGFDDIFSVNQSNLSAFLSLFSKDMEKFSLNELKQTDFNIETDSISFNVKQNKPINYSIHKQYKQSIEALEPYLKDKELFKKIENEE